MPREVVFQMRHAIITRQRTNSVPLSTNVGHVPHLDSAMSSKTIQNGK